MMPEKQVRIGRISGTELGMRGIFDAQRTAVASGGALARQVDLGWPSQPNSRSKIEFRRAVLARSGPMPPLMSCAWRPVLVNRRDCGVPDAWNESRAPSWIIFQRQHNPFSYPDGPPHASKGRPQGRLQKSALIAVRIA